MIFKVVNDTVYGIIWEISIDDKKILDRYEGVRNNCYKPTNLIINKGNKAINPTINRKVEP